MYSGQPLYEQGPFSSSFTSWDTQLFHRQQGQMVRDTLMLQFYACYANQYLCALCKCYFVCVKTAGVVCLSAISLSAAY